MSPSKHILLLEDDPSIGPLIERLLESKGYSVYRATQCAEASHSIEERKFSLLIFDINLPDGNGLDLYKDIKNRGITVPVLFLTARQEEEIAVRAFALGAADYVRKPFGRTELVARVGRILSATTCALAFGALQLNEGTRVLEWEGKTVLLTQRECSILKLLIGKGGDVVARETLYSLSESDADTDSALLTHISHIRGKLKKVGAKNVQISAVYGSGYRIHTK